MKTGRHQELTELRRAADLAPENSHLSNVSAVAVTSNETKAGEEILRDTLNPHVYDQRIYSRLPGITGVCDTR